MPGVKCVEEKWEEEEIKSDTRDGGGLPASSS